jgi:hypothetical protein
MEKQPPAKREPLTNLEVLMIVLGIGGLLLMCALVAGKAAT